MRVCAQEVCDLMRIVCNVSVYTGRPQVRHLKKSVFGVFYTKHKSCYLIMSVGVCVQGNRVRFWVDWVVCVCARARPLLTG